MNNKANGTDKVFCAVQRKKSSFNGARAQGIFTVTCYDKDGNLKWEEKVPNLVVNEGLQYMNETGLGNGTQITTWYLGLYGAGASNSPAAGDTMASHAGWTEVTAYDEAVRQTATFATATTADPSVITNSASAAQFTMNATTTVGGAFLTSDSTKSGTSGTLFSAADFQSPGDRAVVSGDVLNVTYQFSLAAT